MPIEGWLAEDYEAPADEALERATAGQRLTAEQWRHLIRFVAAQDVHSPALYRGLSSQRGRPVLS